MKRSPARLAKPLIAVGIVVGTAALLLALDSSRGENSLPSKWQEFRTCTKQDRLIFRACIAERFPPGSDYRELEAFLIEKKGFSKISTKPVENGTQFIFRWRPSITIVPYGLTVFGRYDENFEVTEVTVP